MYFNLFLQDKYPGAKASPVDLVNMLATPEIDPNIKNAGTFLEKNCFFDLLSSAIKRL